jgi:hypothetical protein
VGGPICVALAATGRGADLWQIDAVSMPLALGLDAFAAR